jgi:hypothetical protein
MKRIRLIIAGMSLSLLLLGAGVWADITITDTTGPDLTYQTSPNVNMWYDDNATAGADQFFINSVNSKGTMEYGIDSEFSGYYQHENSSGNCSETNDFSGWTQMNFD